MKKLLVVPFMAVMLMQFVSVPAWSHDARWWHRHEERMYFNNMNRCGGYGYAPGFNGIGYGYPAGYGYNNGMFSGVHRFFRGY